MELAPMTFRRDDRGEERLVTVGDTWSGRDAYATVSATVTIPTSWRGRRVVGLFDFGRTGGGNNSGFESLLYIDGEPYQGVDANHTEVIFPEDAAGRSLALRFDLWSGLEGGGPPGEQHLRFKRADVAWLDPATDDLYWTARAVLETIHVLGSADAIGVQLQNLLDDTFRLIDWRDPGSPAFYASVSAAREALDQGLARMPAPKAGRITVVGHSHIDVAWLWRLRHTREKAARSFATALRLMDLFPEFVFVQSQPQLYEFVKEDHPGLYARIREHVARGQWEPEGAMWLEADTNLPAGESLVRQVLFGTRFFEQEFGRRCTVLWLPDAFGYSASLPQILKQAGITTFVTTKLSWNQYNRMPHDTFIWRGIDGSEVVAHCLTTPEPEDWNRDDRWFATYNGVVAAGTVVGSWRRYQDRDINDDILMAIGHGDGGGGVTREMLEMRRRLDRIPGLPRVTTGSVADYCRTGTCIPGTANSTWSTTAAPTPARLPSRRRTGTRNWPCETRSGSRHGPSPTASTGGAEHRGASTRLGNSSSGTSFTTFCPDPAFTRSTRMPARTMSGRPP
jgi:alpha-mannosidase